MDPIVVVIAFSLLAAFGGGVLFHKYVISEAAAIKTHVTAEVDKLRAELKKI
jgi:hypothetical protein